MTRDAEYERNKMAWVAKNLENCPPLTPAAQAIIRTAFAAHRVEQEQGAA